MKKKRPMDRKPIKRVQAPKATPSLNTTATFNNLYQRYLDAVYNRVLLPMTHSTDVSDTTLEEIMSVYEGLTARTNL